MQSSKKRGLTRVPRGFLPAMYDFSATIHVQQTQPFFIYFFLIIIIIIFFLHEKNNNKIKPHTHHHSMRTSHESYGGVITTDITLHMMGLSTFKKECKYFKCII